MRQATEIINEASEKLSRDFEVGVNVLSNQTKTWLKRLDAAAERLGLDYNTCRTAARQFKTGDFEGALKTIWGNRLEIDTDKSGNGGNVTIRTYTAGDYAVFTERIEYKNGSFAHSITGRYSESPNPGYSLGTVINVYGKGDSHNIEITDDKAVRDALAARNTANIYNILFVGCDIHSKFLSKPMLKLKKAL
jgi:hypothetical protein